MPQVDPSMYGSQTIAVCVVKPLCSVGKHCAEYRVYTSHETVYTKLVWPLISSHLGCNIMGGRTSSRALRYLMM